MSPERYQGTIEPASGGLWILDADDRTTFVSRSVAELLGYRVRELLGRPAVEFAADPEQVRRNLGRRHAGRAEHFELGLRRKDGEVIWVDMSASPLIDDEDTYHGAVAMITELSERSEALLARRRLEQRLEQSQRLESVGQLAGGIAHDFNNLLAVILNYAYFVREQLPEDSSVRDDLDEIRHAAERASELTHQLLVFSRREAIRPEVLDLNAIVRDVERLLGRTLGERIELVTALASEPCLVEADAAQLEQVLLNLVVNARDAMPEGGEIRIETSRVTLDGARAGAPAGLAPGTYVALSVSDVGSGMEPETASRAFEPFFTTKAKGAGTGLGLATVYGTVTRAGGEAEIESVSGKGTTVRIYLPNVEAPAAGPEERRVAPADRAEGATVLLVEDEDAVRAVTGRILASGGFECLQAAGGEEAIRLYDQNRDRIDLLLTDVVMPDMTGRELVERIGAGGARPAVLFMSGYADEAMIGDGITDGANLLHKPFTPDVLLRSVRDALA